MLSVCLCGCLFVCLLVWRLTNSQTFGADPDRQVNLWIFVFGRFFQPYWWRSCYCLLNGRESESEKDTQWRSGNKPRGQTGSEVTSMTASDVGLCSGRQIVVFMSFLCLDRSSLRQAFKSWDLSIRWKEKLLNGWWTPVDHSGLQSGWDEEVQKGFCLILFLIIVLCRTGFYI